MDLGLNEQQEMLKRSAHDVLEQECPGTHVKEVEVSAEGYSIPLWRKMAELGWLGFPFPEKYGGSEGDFFDLALLCEEMGVFAAPTPFQNTVVQSGLLILEAGSEAQKQSLLPRISRGEIIVSLALTEPSAGLRPQDIATRATASGSDYVINGTKLFVHWAAVADYLICVARTKDSANPADGITLFLVDAKSPGITTTLLKTVASDRQCEVVLNNVRVPAANVLGAVDNGWAAVSKVLPKAIVTRCAEMLGGTQRAFDIALDYVKTRVQFGRVTGSFQSVQHRFADMATQLEASKWATYEAAWGISEGLSSDMAVSAAKAVASDAYCMVTANGHQVHGGIGFYVDVDLQLYYRRAKEAETELGDPNYHRELVAQQMGL